MLPNESPAEPSPMPTISMNPLNSVHPLSSGGQPLASPIKGSTHRPVFGPENLRPPSEILPTSVRFLDTAAQLQRDQERRERQAAAERERIAAMPTKEEQQLRRIVTLEADLADMHTRFAQLEARVLGRSRARGPDDHPPKRAA